MSTLALLAPFALFALLEEPSLEERLARLTESLEAVRVESHVPGMSVAVVKDDQVVYARGFGFADLEHERPADADTIYAIGSTTKAFTSTLIGMLVDEGEMAWDDPVTDYLEEFDLAVRSDDPGAECTLRDLLSHRHGFSRMGILWFGGEASRDEILRAAANAEPWDDFRAAFHYCNVTYLAAGEAAGVAADLSWDELIRERFFEPLGMDSSSVSIEDVRGDERLATGYRWVEADEGWEEDKLVNLDPIGPAGSINSSVRDMAQWLRLQLGRGAVDDMELVTRERVDETWTPQIPIAGGITYGLGWMLHEVSGHRVVEHGGNINGYSAQVALVPEEDLGFVLLTNLSVAPIQQPSIPLVIDALLGEWEEETAVAAEGIPYEDFVGRYHADFARFRGEMFEVTSSDEGITLSLPGGVDLLLNDPGDDGLWYPVLTDQTAVSFQRDDAGDVTGLTMHEGGFRFPLQREGAPVSEESEEALAAFAATYEHASGERIEIRVLRGGLLLDSESSLLPLGVPEDDRVALAGHATFDVEFERDDAGRVAGVAVNGPGGMQAFERVVEEGVEPLPSVEEILELCRASERDARRRASGSSRAVGKVWVPQAGVTGTVTVLVSGDERFASTLDFGSFGRIETAVDGEEAWSRDPMQGLRTLKGLQLAQTRLEHPATVEGDWRRYFETIDVLRREAVGERTAYVVRLAAEGALPRTYWIDAELGDVLRVERVSVDGGIQVPITVTLSDYREEDGLRAAWRVELENEQSGRTVLEFETMEAGVEIPASAFRLDQP